MLAAQTLTAAAVAVLALVVVIEFALMAIGLVDLLRRQADEVTGGNKLIWILVIVLLGVLGPILYFAMGRRSSPAVAADDQAMDGHASATAPAVQGVSPAPESPTDDRARRAADLLYGERPDD